MNYYSFTPYRHVKVQVLGIILLVDISLERDHHATKMNSLVDRITAMLALSLEPLQDYHS